MVGRKYQLDISSARDTQREVFSCHGAKLMACDSMPNVGENRCFDACIVVRFHSHEGVNSVYVERIYDHVLRDELSS